MDQQFDPKRLATLPKNINKNKTKQKQTNKQKSIERRIICMNVKSFTIEAAFAINNVTSNQCFRLTSGRILRALFARLTSSTF